MTSALVRTNAIVYWDVTRTAESDRIYKIIWKAVADAADGPATVADTPGLPGLGATWAYGNDSDPWAFLTPEMRVTPILRNETNIYWHIEQTFATAGARQPRRCADQSIDDPLLEPAKISGSFVKYTKEATEDKDGNAIKNSAHEMVRGAAVEFDANRPTVVIEMNTGTLGLSNFASMVGTVNDDTLWELAARKVKLDNVSWSRQLYGLCNFYYTRRFEFSVDFNTFDRPVTDEGTKVLHGEWAADGSWSLLNIDGSPPDKTDPTHFDRYKDKNDENARVLLDGNGEPLTTGTPVSIPGGDVDYYPESDFTTLGLPTEL